MFDLNLTFFLFFYFSPTKPEKRSPFFTSTPLRQPSNNNNNNNKRKLTTETGPVLLNFDKADDSANSRNRFETHGTA